MGFYVTNETVIAHGATNTIARARMPRRSL